ncbi:MAG: hypothetical protein LBF65_00560 [Holosporales bacterium]|jgi:hypothetical protein|nr:hypothetical protein [Holosporales bacterium]
MKQLAIDKIRNIIPISSHQKNGGQETRELGSGAYLKVREHSSTGL